MLSENELKILQQQLQPILPLIAQAADVIIDQDVSRYPVFIVSKSLEDIGLGLPVVPGTTNAGDWSVNASTLEELAAKQVVAMEKVDQFRSIYKSNSPSLCMLVWREGPAQFAFLPRPSANE